MSCDNHATHVLAVAIPLFRAGRRSVLCGAAGDEGLLGSGLRHDLGFLVGHLMVSFVFVVLVFPRAGTRRAGRGFGCA